MNPLVAIFGAGVRVRNALYDCGLFRDRRLEGPVVSIGNLSAGGSGKTPFVILLGELLQQHSIAFDVLSRGYRRSSRGVVLVEAAGPCRQYGDEPLLIARRLQVPVVVGEDRYRAGCFAEEKFGPRLHLLDDGFQHRQLARDFDIVLVTPDDGQDRLLPVGRLRETPAALSRADAVVLPRGLTTAGLPLNGKLVWRIRRGIRLEGVPDRPLAFCGIAHPQRFFGQLCEAGVQPAAVRSFRDHHPYTPADIANLERLRKRSGAGGFVTTEKDALNLGEFGRRLAPLAIVPVTMELEDAEKAIAAMLSRIAERRRL